MYIRIYVLIMMVIIITIRPITYKQVDTNSNKDVHHRRSPRRRLLGPQGAVYYSRFCSIDYIRY